jgi:hypothetical protein
MVVVALSFPRIVSIYGGCRFSEAVFPLRECVWVFDPTEVGPLEAFVVPDIPARVPVTA